MWCSALMEITGTSSMALLVWEPEVWRRAETSPFHMANVRMIVNSFSGRRAPHRTTQFLAVTKVSVAAKVSEQLILRTFEIRRS